MAPGSTTPSGRWNGSSRDMSLTVGLIANDVLTYPEAGGHFWVYANWALGLRALGCRVIWLEAIDPTTGILDLKASLAVLRSRLARYDISEAIALFSSTEEGLSREAAGECQDLGVIGEADLLLNLAYQRPSAVGGRFRRSVLVDIDPGLSQVWMSNGQMKLEEHDLYYTIGETVGQAEALFPDCGVRWHYTPPPVYLPVWPVTRAELASPYTTVTHWGDDTLIYQGTEYDNGKREGFLPFLDLPRRTRQQVELAIFLEAKDEQDRRVLLERGWRVRDSHAVASTPWDYQHYIQQSRGEFSCVKPSCILLQNAWISDRTLCYLASGKPAVVQHTGPSRFLPDAGGLFRFRDIEEAKYFLEAAAADYDRQCKLARALAEEYFDAGKVVRRVLERALA